MYREVVTAFILTESPSSSLEFTSAGSHLRTLIAHPKCVDRQSTPIETGFAPRQIVSQQSCAKQRASQLRCDHDLKFRLELNQEDLKLSPSPLFGHETITLLLEV